ncbi:MAG: hypothetical protein FJ395_18870 [Verrucomicrobia bacterium]|nr:hypothetical protein [Verrucomicrobiota bacterium]
MAHRMNSDGTNQLIEAVEKTTGFKVIVDTVEGISDDAQMISARPEMPIHSIRVNKTKLPYADYIVATQCAMLIRLWSNPKRIPVFSPNTDKVHFFADRMAKSKPLKQFPARTATETALHLAQGLLHQLRSAPMEIQTVRDCRTQCPDLLDMQTDSVEAYLRLLSQNFAPEIRSIAPDQTWKNSVSMNSAYALNWSGITGSILPMLPYQSAGFADIAETLLTEISTRPDKTSEAYTQIVDVWAGHLGLNTLYKWEYRNGLQ